jgi:hypothetical protein
MFTGESTKPTRILTVVTLLAIVWSTTGHFRFEFLLAITSAIAGLEIAALAGEHLAGLLIGATTDTHGSTVS